MMLDGLHDGAPAVAGTHLSMHYYAIHYVM